MNNITLKSLQKVAYFLAVFLAMTACGTLISGCGTKGPLYIPEQRYPQKDAN